MIRAADERREAQKRARGERAASFVRKAPRASHDDESESADAGHDAGDIELATVREALPVPASSFDL